MPELPEVEITRQKLLPLIRGRRILDFWTNWPRGLRAADSVKRVAGSMHGRKIFDVTRRGKVLFFELSGAPPRTLAIHLRMSGRLEIVPTMTITMTMTTARHPKPSPLSSPSSPLSSWPSSTSVSSSLSSSSSDRWIHFRWLLSPRHGSGQAGNRELRFIDPRKFGLVWYGSPEELSRDPYVGRLGRDANKVTLNEFKEIFRNGRGMIKPFLLRQDKFAGIGNIIADETLWASRIHPKTQLADLAENDIVRLHHALQQTIRAILSSGGTTLRNWAAPGGKSGRFQDKRKIYGRAGESCPRCRTTLKRIIAGGRGTTVCPRCQRT